MASSNELVIKISGDIKNYQAALEEAQGKTEDLENSLGKIAKVSAVAFAALTGEILFAAKAFGESQAASNRLTQALQNQGVYTDDLLKSYQDIAKEIQKKTGLDDDSVISAQALIQGMIGQQEVTLPLTKAIADLAAAKDMDLSSTAELIGKGINGQVAGLQKLGIVVDENLDKQERTARIVELVTQRFGGQAEAANKGLGSIRGLASAFGDFQEEIGARFAPVLEIAIQKLTSFIQEVSNNKPLLDLITSVITAGAVVATLGIAVGTAGTAFLALKAALTAAGVATSAMTVATRALVGATGLGLLAIIATEIYLNWNTAWPRMQAVFSAFASSVAQISGGVGEVLKGAFSFDTSRVKAGIDEIKTAIANGYKDATAEIKPISVDVGGSQDPQKLAAAQEQASKEVQIEKIKHSLIVAEQQLALMKAGEFSQQQIALKQQEIETIKALQSAKDSDEKIALEEKLAELQQIEATANELNIAQKQEFYNQLLADSSAYNELNKTQQDAFLQANGDKLRQSLETEKSIRLTYAQQQLQADIKRRNDFLLDEQKFGTAYAIINKTMHSEIAAGTRSAFGELAQLQQSKSNELKAIGKAAAIANIIISTQESAMNVFKGFSIIPFVGPILGGAAAAAVVAFGAERIGQVVSAADGGIVTGGIPGVDSIPSLLMDGEMVVPKRNFEEVVSAVANQRNGTSEGNGGVTEIVLTLKDDLVEFIEARLIERSRLNISLQGAT